MAALNKLNKGLATAAVTGISASVALPGCSSTDGTNTASSPRTGPTREASTTGENYADGEDIDDVNLDRAAGSSGTPDGFNDALQKIKEAASRYAKALLGGDEIGVATGRNVLVVAVPVVVKSARLTRRAPKTATLRGKPMRSGVPSGAQSEAAGCRLPGDFAEVEVHGLAPAFDLGAVFHEGGELGQPGVGVLPDGAAVLGQGVGAYAPAVEAGGLPRG